MLSVTQSVWVPELSESRYSVGWVNMTFPNSKEGTLTVDIKYEPIGASIRVLDFEQCRAALGREGRGRSPVVAGEENHLGFGTCAADASHDGLDSVCPFVDVGDVVGLFVCYYWYRSVWGKCRIYLVHDPKHHLRVAGILGGQLRPQADELLVGWPSLSYDLSVPTRVCSDYHVLVTPRQHG